MHIQWKPGKRCKNRITITNLSASAATQDIDALARDIAIRGRFLDRCGLCTRQCSNKERRILEICRAAIVAALNRQAQEN